MRKKDPTFGEAFKKARKEKGPNSTFNYKGKKYSTVTQDQVKKAGYSTLRQYLNAGGKKKTSVKKPMKKYIAVPKMIIVPKRKKICPLLMTQTIQCIGRDLEKMVAQKEK